MTVIGNHTVVPTMANVTQPPLSWAGIAVQPSRKTHEVRRMPSHPAPPQYSHRSLVYTDEDRLPSRVFNPMTKFATAIIAMVIKVGVPYPSAAHTNVLEHSRLTVLAQHVSPAAAALRSRAAVLINRVELCVMLRDRFRRYFFSSFPRKKSIPLTIIYKCGNLSDLPLRKSKTIIITTMSMSINYKKYFITFS